MKRHIEAARTDELASARNSGPGRTVLGRADPRAARARQVARWRRAALGLIAGYARAEGGSGETAIGAAESLDGSRPAFSPATAGISVTGDGR